jgi:hypothetical protein
MKAKKKVARTVTPAVRKTTTGTTTRRTPAKRKAATARASSAAPAKPKRKSAVRKVAQVKVPPKLPAILFEGDAPTTPQVGGPGE